VFYNVPGYVPTIIVPPATLVDASTPVPGASATVGATATLGPQPVPPGVDKPTVTPVGSFPTAVVPVLPPAVPALPSDTVVPTCTIDAPCYSHVVMPILDENVGGVIIGSLIIYCVLTLFVRQLRYLWLGAWLVAVVLVVITGLQAWVYGWLLLVAGTGFVEGIRALFPVRLPR
jgi:hypothetical protein